MTDKAPACETCLHWQRYTTLFSVDGLEFGIGHCNDSGAGRGLVADNHYCGLYWNGRDDASPPTAGEAE